MDDLTQRLENATIESDFVSLEWPSALWGKLFWEERHEILKRLKERDKGPQNHPHSPARDK